MFIRKSSSLLHPLLRGTSNPLLSRSWSSTVLSDGPCFPGAVTSQYSETLEFVHNTSVIPTFRVLDKHGKIMNQKHAPKITQEWGRKVYKDMLTLNVMDMILYEAQRQGRISFYMTNYGEEATHMGSAAALDASDTIYGQYREAGVLLYRGFQLSDFMHQCFSNHCDLGKGRQMPVHYGSKALSFQTISSPLATQLPQSVGAAYALKLKQSKNIVACYFGEGAASEGDFHAALNMATTTEAPVLFFCRNNGFAISTPVSDQYRGDGIAARGLGYGMATLRVDGNDVLAVYAATQYARAHILTHQQPVLMEAMTYRVGHHSTSDDSSAYRSKKEVDDWKVKDNPVVRFRKYLESLNWWDEKQEKEVQQTLRSEVLAAFHAAEKEKRPALKELFSDVYHELTPRLKEQEKELQSMIQSYPEHFPTEEHVSN